MRSAGERILHDIGAFARLNGRCRFGAGLGLRILQPGFLRPDARLDLHGARTGARRAGGGNSGQGTAERQHFGFGHHRRAPRGLVKELFWRNRHGRSRPGCCIQEAPRILATATQAVPAGSART